MDAPVSGAAYVGAAPPAGRHRYYIAVHALDLPCVTALGITPESTPAAPASRGDVRRHDATTPRRHDFTEPNGGRGVPVHMHSRLDLCSTGP